MRKRRQMRVTSEQQGIRMARRLAQRNRRQAEADWNGAMVGRIYLAERIRCLEHDMDLVFYDRY